MRVFVARWFVVGALVLPVFGAQGDVPMAVYPACWETHLDEDCPSDLDGDWSLVSYVDERFGNVRDEELELGSGISADRAWALTAGSPDVLVAVLDCGIKWDTDHVLRKHYLNRGELLEPQDANGVAHDGVWDLDGSGVFNIDDYAFDPRLSFTDGVDVADEILDPSDLIHNPLFSDGVDDDGNGYVDDISGWDFHWNDNDPYDDTRYDHGTFEARTSVAEGNDGGDIGVCPNCMLLNVRTGDAFIMDGDNFGSGVLFATDSGASVIQAASGTLGHSRYVEQAMAYAYDEGVTLVCAAADETSFHHNSPSTDPHALSVKAVRYDEDEDEDITTFLNYSNCTNFGPRVELSASSTGCASGGTAMVAGAAALVASAGVEAGVEPTLRPGEIAQLLIGTSDDIDIEESRGEDADPNKYPSYPGYDLYFGYGRINVGRAVEAVFAGQIPPAIFIEEPLWFEPFYVGQRDVIDVSGWIEGRTDELTVTVAWAPGGDPREDEFTQLTQFSVDGNRYEGDLAQLPISDVLAGERTPPRALTEEDDNVSRALMAHGWMVNFRIDVEDGNGNRAVTRRTLSVLEDNQIRPGFPLDLGASAEGSPALADVDGDGLPDILIATADGLLHVMDGDGTPLEGWPAPVELLEEADPDQAVHHLESAAYTSGAVSPDAYSAVLSSPAVDDLDGDGTVEIVVTSLRGHVHVFNAMGVERDGFPRSLDPLLSDPETTSPSRIVDRGFGSSPSLGDLDGDGDLEIVAGGMDGWIYAWHDNGMLVDGWPVALSYDGPDQWPVARIVGTPAIGDISGDGIPDVAVGTNESVSSFYGLAYAVHGTGNLSPGGAYLDGWPVTLFGAFTAALPVVGEGTTASPALVDLDGDGALEVVLPTTADPGMILRSDGESYIDLGHFDDQYGALSNTRSGAFLHGVSSPSVGDLDGDGTPDVINGGIDPEFGMGIVGDGKRREFDHVLGAWSPVDGMFIRGFPRQVEDIQFFMNPAVADLDGDDNPEVICGSGGFMLHAFNYKGDEPDGWPKNTGGWITASPAVHDIDGDGRLEVITATRSGYLFAWDVPGPVHGNVQWASFHHDVRNSGNFELDLGFPPPPPPTVYNQSKAGCRCSADTTGGPSPRGGIEARLWMALLGIVAMMIRRRGWGVRR